MTLDNYDENIAIITIAFNIDLVGVEEKEQLIADSFGLGYRTQNFQIYKDFKLDLTKQLYFITGDSGSGKSLLLKYLKDNIYKKDDYIDFNDIKIDDNEKLYNITDNLEKSIKYLNLIGLGDAFLFLNKYTNLSDGQKTRYKLLKCLLSDKKIIFIDEFLATLDRETALVVAFNLQRTVRTNFKDKKFFLSTTHNDLYFYLQADITIEKLYGINFRIFEYDKVKNVFSANPFLKHINIKLDKELGKKYWSEIFSEFHYKNHNISFLIDIALLYLRKEDINPIGIIVYKHGSYKVNQEKQDLARISRVVLLPKYRGVGLAHHFVKEANKLFFEKYKDFNHIDTVALMAQYNPFFVKTDMKEIDTFYPSDDGLQLKKILEERKINFYRFRIDKDYALKNLTEDIKEKLIKLYINKKRSYTSFNVKKQLPNINIEIEKFLVYLEVLQPKKYIISRENIT